MFKGFDVVRLVFLEVLLKIEKFVLDVWMDKKLPVQ